MTSLDRLKQTFTGARRTIALPLVTLAVATLGAQAATFIPDSASCDGGTVSTSALPDVNGVTGVKIFTTAPCSVTDTGGTGTATINLTVSGGPGGTFDLAMVSFPVNFVFTINSSDTYDIIFYTLSLQLNGLTVQQTSPWPVSAGTTVNSADGENFNSFSYFLDSAGMALNSWTLTLLVTQTDPFNGGGQTLSLDIPPNSIDITGPASGGESPSPEPSSLLLLGSGVGLLLFSKRSLRRV
ncbi:MAG: PEP-CTERM sorting domain-containing protein [Bryobacterales bacterium]|nr:PEP-CTERM sorting domain-containing protein [Bryobacterales bacterium]